LPPPAVPDVSKEMVSLGEQLITGGDAKRGIPAWNPVEQLRNVQYRGWHSHRTPLHRLAMARVTEETLQWLAPNLHVSLAG
jgi:hypothetical protein